MNRHLTSLVQLIETKKKIRRTHLLEASGLMAPFHEWGQKMSKEACQCENCAKEDEDQLLGQAPQALDQKINKLLTDNPKISGPTLLNLLKSNGLEIVDKTANEADTSSGFPQATRAGVQKTEKKHSAKWQSCVHKVQKKGGDVDPYAVCTAQLGDQTFESEGGEGSGRKPGDGNKKPSIKVKPNKGFGKTIIMQSKKESTNLNLRSRLLESKQTDTGLGYTKFRAVLLQEGMGNFNDQYYYSQDALQSAIAVFEGKKIYADHPSEIDEQVRPERSVRDILGYFENVSVSQQDDGTHCLEADVCTLPDDEHRWARTLMTQSVSYSQKYPDKEFVGLSINASGASQEADIDEILNSAPEGAKPKLIQAKEQGITTVKVVSQIESAVSCDLVTEAGAGGKILNLIEQEKSMLANIEGGPGSGRHKGGGKSPQKTNDKKSGSVGKKINTQDALKIANDFEKTGAGHFSRNSDGSMTMWIKGDPQQHGNDWNAARKIQGDMAKIGAHSDIEPDPMSGHLKLNFKNVYGENKESEGIYMKQNEKKEKKENEAEKQEAVGAQDDAPVQPHDDQHDDEQQDIALIKKMIAQYMGAGEENESEAHEDESHHEDEDKGQGQAPGEPKGALAVEAEAETMEAAMEAYQAYSEMGYPKEEAIKAAAHAMKLAKHMASKREAHQAEAGDDAHPKIATPSAPQGVQPAGQPAKKEAAVIAKLVGRNALLETKIKKYELNEYLETILRESGLGRDATKQFRKLVEDAKVTSKKQVEPLWAAFKEGHSARGGEAIGTEFLFLAPEKTTKTTAKSGLDLSDCAD